MSILRPAGRTKEEELKKNKKHHKNRKDVKRMEKKKSLYSLYIYIFYYNSAQGLIQSVRSEDNATGVMS